MLRSVLSHTCHHLGIPSLFLALQMVDGETPPRLTLEESD